MRCVLVLDIGKTNVKLALVDADAGRELAVRRQPNGVLPGPPYPHFDTGAIWRFVLESLADLGREATPEALSITAHGATGALVRRDGELALPVLDYEHDGPDELAAEYDALRPGFAETGSPRLPGGLNLGAQIFWQMRRFPDAAAEAALFLTWPQYWAYRLTAVAAVEATSLGCHTDLWLPRAGRFSPLVTGQGWDRLMPPLRRAADVLGPIRPEIAAETGLPPDLPVLCGIHDSNASLLPHLLSRPAPFAVVSTGTWVIAMAVGGEPAPLDPARDTLINVDAQGHPVPSARFMGGREYEIIRGGVTVDPGPRDIDRVLDDGLMLLPAVEPGSGPFRGRAHRWSDGSAGGAADPGRRGAALSFYLALMTATCLKMIGARGPVVVEGPFGGNLAYRQMLEAATGRPVSVSESGVTGTAVGAAMLAAGLDLAGGALPPQADDRPVSPAPAATDPRMRSYAEAWSAAVAAG